MIEDLRGDHQLVGLRLFNERRDLLPDGLSDPTIDAFSARSTSVPALAVPARCHSSEGGGS